MEELCLLLSKQQSSIIIILKTMIKFIKPKCWNATNRCAIDFGIANWTGNQHRRWRINLLTTTGERK